MTMPEAMVASTLRVLIAIMAASRPAINLRLVTANWMEPSRTSNSGSTIAENTAGGTNLRIRSI